MGVNEDEGFGKKVKDFFTQKPEDHDYQKKGGDDRVPEGERTDDPQADANRYAVAHGEELPYPEHPSAAAPGTVTDADPAV